MVPFFSSMETVSLLSFIRNLEHIHRKNPSSAAKPLPVFNPPHIFPGRSKNLAWTKSAQKSAECVLDTFVNGYLSFLKKLRITKEKKERERSPGKTYLTSFMLPNRLVVVGFCRS
jgi:hypothetical protein